MDPEVSRYYAILFPNFTFDRLLLLWFRSRRNNEYPEEFLNRIDHPMRDSIVNLARLQFGKIDDYLHGSDDPSGTLRQAFIEFGQGTLYDPRRQPGKRVHKMEGDPPAILIGYYRWHIFLRALSLISQNANPRLPELDQYVGLSWAVASEMQPVHDPDDTEPRPGEDPRNPRMDPIRLQELESFWLAQDFEGMDNAFDNDELKRFMCNFYQIC
jgi:hypothetical protein